MKTKILLLALLGVFSSLNLSSQSLRAGINLANFIDKNDTALFHPLYDADFGFHFGAEVDLDLSPLFSLETGLNITTRGCKLAWSDSGFTATARTVLYYITLPVSGKMYVPVSVNFKPFVSFGPYVGVAILGKIKAKATKGTQSGEGEDNISFSDGGLLKRYDYGLQMSGGMQIARKVELGAYYDLGLANISSNTQNGTLVQNRVLRFSVKLFLD